MDLAATLPEYTFSDDLPSGSVVMSDNVCMSSIFPNVLFWNLFVGSDIDCNTRICLQEAYVDQDLGPFPLYSTFSHAPSSILAVLFDNVYMSNNFSGVCFWILFVGSDIGYNTRSSLQDEFAVASEVLFDHSVGTAICCISCNVLLLIPHLAGFQNNDSRSMCCNWQDDLVVIFEVSFCYNVCISICCTLCSALVTALLSVVASDNDGIS
jgi:hypothetical protein